MRPNEDSQKAAPSPRLPLRPAGSPPTPSQPPRFRFGRWWIAFAPVDFAFVNFAYSEIAARAHGRYA